SIGHVNPRHPLRSSLTAREVVLSGATGTTELMTRWEPTPEIIERAESLIDLLGVRPFDDSLWPTMSQGERDKTSIARALITDPSLLHLDEPSTGRDVAAREQFLETVHRLHSSQPKLATMLVTHHLEELPKTPTHAMLIKHG